MFTALIVFHVIVCLILIATILLQAGRGGGLTEMFGGESAQSILGTQAPVLLKRATEASAVAFIITSLLLGMITARRGKSLFEGAVIPQMPVQQEAPILPYQEPADVAEPNIPESMDEAAEPVTAPVDDNVPQETSGS
jgi:preprotein translocase subunit SecG